MSRSLVSIGCEIIEKEEQARMIGQRIMSALKENAPFQALTQRHNELYDEVQELINERSQRMNAAKECIENNKSKIFSENGINVAELNVPTSDIIFMLFKCYGIVMESKEQTGEWTTITGLACLNSDDISAIRAIK